MLDPLHTPAYREIMARVKALRVEAGLTQRELATRLRWDQAVVARMEHGDRRVDLVDFIKPTFPRWNW
ncbi:MAG: helix-turn-helix transcriptional regulator, partial [Planctomycetota bacterium]|nr:helix-turn-helix transcriptional regulator [Planctomycetota bacterium]